MKTPLTVRAVMMITLCALFCAAASAKPGDRVLVLGFESAQLNDLQDRLLRETVMRRLHTEGYRVVPVMEIESAFNEERKGRIRMLLRSEIRAVCDEMNAGFALSGAVRPEDGSRGGEIVPGKNYVCSMVLYRRDGNRFMEFRVAAAGGKTLYEFYDTLAALIARGIGDLL